MPVPELNTLRNELLAWYDSNRRSLPWREGSAAPADPYRVWLSEAMLQQTRVDTVIPYYHRWLERFPSLNALAEASLDEVLKAWEGLGYYSRARNLHRAVREVRDRYNGRVPDDPEAFRSLPGVGRYTAGAVLSIAFGREEPVVDGNVRRVFARLTDSPAPAESELWDLAGRLVRGDRPGDLNQAVMELGATVCTPRRPRCDACPIAADCAARAAGTQNERPLPRRRAPLPLETRVAAIIESEAGLLLARRSGRGRLAGLWEFPGDLVEPGSSLLRIAPDLLHRLTGVTATVEEELATVRHTFTHVRVDYRVVRGRSAAHPPRAGDYDEVRWFPRDALHEIALPRAQRTIAALAGTSEPSIAPR